MVERFFRDDGCVAMVKARNAERVLFHFYNEFGHMRGKDLTVSPAYFDKRYSRHRPQLAKAA